jgi:fibro-slime domain-containing protein
MLDVDGTRVPKLPPGNAPRLPVRVRCRVAMAGVLAVVLPALPACGGGRSPLLSLGEPCAVPNDVRPCSNDCGEGTQICRDGVWHSCDVPVIERACADACGAGRQTCRYGTWSRCAVPEVAVDCTSLCGRGQRTCREGDWGDCTARQLGPPRLLTTLRDFHSTHPDFERRASGDLSELGLVEPVLGSDDTPVYARSGGSITVTGPETFAQWYHDVPGVNVTIPYEIPLKESAAKPGLYQFVGYDFFPLDGDPHGFGDEGQAHDFDFTLATHFSFRYVGGELFRFEGDDDLWVFVNRHLAIDLGGLHEAKMGEVYLDQRRTELDIEPDNVYEVHLFFAERHVINSDFVVETTIADPSCP